jgi:hypothetical protein
MDTDSVGSLLFESFMAVAPGDSMYLNQWDPADPVATPNTLVDPEAAVGYLRSAVEVERLRNRPLDTKYGDFMRLPTSLRAYDNFPEEGGFVVCMLVNDCIVEGINLDCVVRNPITNPNPVCGDYLEPISLAACITACPPDNTACLLRCVQDNVQFENPLDPIGETLPGNGCSDCFRNSYFFGQQSGGGDSWVGVIEFTPNGPIAKGSIPYGNASPHSRGADLGHVNDQMRLFSDKQLRTLWRTREEINANLEEEATVSADICDSCTDAEVCDVICGGGGVDSEESSGLTTGETVGIAIGATMGAAIVIGATVGRLRSTQDFDEGAKEPLTGPAVTVQQY